MVTCHQTFVQNDNMCTKNGNKVVTNSNVLPKNGNILPKRVTKWKIVIKMEITDNKMVTCLAKW